MRFILRCVRFWEWFNHAQADRVSAQWVKEHGSHEEDSNPRSKKSLYDA